MKKLIARSFDRSSDSYSQQAYVQAEMAQQLCAVLPQESHFHNVLEFGVGTGYLSERFFLRCQCERYTINDFSGSMLESCHRKLRSFLSDSVKQKCALITLAGDIEKLAPTLSESYDLILSSATLQWIEDPFALLDQLYAHLTPGGQMLIGTFGEDNLREIKALSGKGLAYPCLRQFEEWAERAGAKFTCYAAYQKKLFFDSPLAVLRHLKETGVTYLPTQAEPLFLSRKGLTHFCDEYIARYSEGSRVGLTYHPLLLRFYKACSN